MAQFPCIDLDKPCSNLPFGDGDRHVQTDHGVFVPTKVFCPIFRLQLLVCYLTNRSMVGGLCIFPHKKVSRKSTMVTKNPGTMDLPEFLRCKHC